MQTGTAINLSATEITGIWYSYTQTSLDLRIFEFFLSNVKDTEIRSLIENAKNIYEQRILKLKDVSNLEGLPIPFGYTKDDIDINAPSIFTDNFYPWYLNIKTYYDMGMYALVLNNISRPDLREYFSKSIMETSDIYNKDMDLLTAKGLFMNAPKMEVLKEIAFVKQKSFLGSFLGNQRSILTNEATMIYIKILYSTINRAIFAGFGRVAASKRVKDFMIRGRDITTKHIEILSQIFSKDNVPVPSMSESFITDSKIAPFSDKLMMFLTLTLTQLVLVNAGIAALNSFRKDILAVHVKNAADLSKLSIEGYSLLIENGWMEQPPQAINSENLVRC